MSKRYYANFPAAPIELVSALSAASGISTIVDARVAADMSVFLDIAQDLDEVDGFRLTAKHLQDIADFCGIELEDVFMEPGEEGTMSVTAWATNFDFTALFKGTPYEKNICYPREEQEVEEVEAAFANLSRVLNKFPVKVEEEVDALADCGPDCCKEALPGEQDSEEEIEVTQQILAVKAKADAAVAKLKE